MEFFFQPLTLLTFFPLLGVLVLLFIPSERKDILRWVTLGTSLAVFALSLWVLSMFHTSDPDLQLKAQYNWITVAGWNIQYYLAVDGLSILLVLLTIFPVARSGHGWCLPRSRLISFLHLLGIYACTDVLHHRHLGRTATNLCRHQVLPVYDGWFHFDAARHPVARHLWQDLFCT